MCPASEDLLPPYRLGEADGGCFLILPQQSDSAAAWALFYLNSLWNQKKRTGESTSAQACLSWWRHCNVFSTSQFQPILGMFYFIVIKGFFLTVLNNFLFCLCKTTRVCAVYGKWDRCRVQSEPYTKRRNEQAILQSAILSSVLFQYEK